jgi:hypothetical protein
MIRFAEAADLPRLMPLLRDFHASSSVSLIPFDEEETWRQLVEAHYAPNEKKIILVSDVGGKITGLLIAFTAQVFFSKATKAFEAVWWVDPHYAKSGVKLFKAYEFWAKKVADFTGTSSQVHTSNLAAFYEREGFIKTEQSYLKDNRNGS